MVNLSKEERALFSLLGARIDFEDDVDWGKVEQEAMHQAVYILASNSVKRPKSLDWSNRTFRYIYSGKKIYYQS